MLLDGHVRTNRPDACVRWVRSYEADRASTLANWSVSSPST